MLKNDNVRKEITGLLERFTNPDSLDLIAKSMFKRGIDIPSDNWSLLNRLIMLSHGTLDARGSKAWFRTGRYAMKASHFCIIAPKIITVESKDKKGKKETRLIGFRPIAVWAAEKTKGSKIEYKPDQPMPNFVGKELAESWGIEIEQGFENLKYYAFYSPTENKIRMATPDQQSFFHELAHAADDRIKKYGKVGEQTDQEIVAEFSSTILMRMFGLRSGEKNAYDYIVTYANRQHKDPIDSVIPLISRISKVVNLVMEENEKMNEVMV